MDFQDSHPSDQELILAADGELPDARAERLRKHLAGCWKCRVRNRELQEALADFVGIHFGTLDPLLPPGSGSRALFKAELDRLASSCSSDRASWSWLLPLACQPRATAIYILAAIFAVLTVFSLT